MTTTTLLFHERQPPLTKQSQKRLPFSLSLWLAGVQSKQSQIKRDHFSLSKANFTIHGQSIYSIPSKKCEFQLQSATDFIFSPSRIIRTTIRQPLKIVKCDWSKFAVELSCPADCQTSHHITNSDDPVLQLFLATR